MPKTVLSLDAVTKDFGNARAVDRLSLRVNEGEIFGLIGPNGSGKTTTLKMVVGLYRPTRGRIKVGGSDVIQEPTKAKRRIGYVPDDPVAYDRLTGREFLEFVGELFGMDRERREERIVRLLAAYGIEDLADGYFGRFSRGTKQKIAMAAGLLHDPALMLIDEPLVGLAPASLVVTEQLLRSYADAGGSVLLSTHTLDVAEDLCDRFGVLYRGRVVATGTLAELREKAGIKRGSLETVFLRIVQGL